MASSFISSFRKFYTMAQTKKATTKKAGRQTSSSGQKTNKGTDNLKRIPQASGSEENNNESLLEKFFHDQLKDIYYAEKQIIKALPLMQKACSTEELKDAFENHLHQSNKHIKRLEKVFKLLNSSAEGKKCEAMDGLIKECESIIKETRQGSMTRDAALIMGAQKIEHYEIATYGGLVQLAITIGEHEVAELLDTTLGEEEDADCLLTDIAEGYINIEAEEEQKFSRANAISKRSKTLEEVE
jgi:ferritin-like metal-binding protein YciE